MRLLGLSGVARARKGEARRRRRRKEEMECIVGGFGEMCSSVFNDG